MANFYAWKMIGAAGVTSYAAAKLLARADMLSFRRYKLVAVPVDGMPKMPKEFSVRPLSPEALAQHDIDAGPETQALRFASGLTCLGTFNAKGVLVAVSWVSTADYQEDEVHLRYIVPPKSCWDTGLWVAPEHRGGRAFAACWAGTADWMREQGCHWSLSRITDYNLASIQSHKRMKAATLRHFIAIRIGRWQFAPAARPRLVAVDTDPPPSLGIQLPVR